MRVLTPFEDRVGTGTPVTPVGLAGAGVAGRICPAVRDWRLDKKLGTGSTAYVYAATNLTDGRRAALKILRAHVDESTQRRFLREGYVANAVGHPGVVQIFDQGVTEEGELFIVMELLDGESLDSLRTRSGGKLPVRQVIDIGCELLDILGAAHARRVIHRDLKPANIWVGKDGKLKVLDFGLAYIAEPSRSSSITGTGVMMGTPAFMPPEQARGRRDEVDARSDIWALGATLFALVAGRAVHVAASHPGQMLAILTRPAPSLHSVAPHVPRAVAAIIDRAIAFERNDRWPDAESMAEALRWARIGLDGGAGPAPPRTSHFDLASTPVTPVRTADVTDAEELDSDEKTRVASYAFSTFATARARDPEDDAAEDSPVEKTKLHVRPRSFVRAPDVSAPPPVAMWSADGMSRAEPRSGSIATSVSTGPDQVRQRAPGFLNGTVAAGIAAGVMAGALALGLIIATERFHKRPAPAVVAAPPSSPLTAVTAALPETTATATATATATEAEPASDMPAAAAIPTASEPAAASVATTQAPPIPKAEAKTEPKPEAKPAPKPELKVEAKPDAKPEERSAPPPRAAATVDPKPEPERDDTSPLNTEGRPREL